MVSIIERRSRQIAEEHGQKFIPPDHMSRIIVAVVIGLALQSIFQKEMDIDGVYESFKIMLKQQGIYRRDPSRQHSSRSLTSPIAISMISGLIFSTVLTLIVVPNVYLLVENTSKRKNISRPIKILNKF